MIAVNKELTEILCRILNIDKDGNLIQVLVMTKEELTDILTKWYDGASWEHDFGPERNIIPNI